jgi:hypothetical protein
MPRAPHPPLPRRAPAPPEQPERAALDPRSVTRRPRIRPAPSGDGGHAEGGGTGVGAPAGGGDALGAGAGAGGATVRRRSRGRIGAAAAGRWLRRGGWPSRAAARPRRAAERRPRGSADRAGAGLAAGSGRRTPGRPSCRSAIRSGWPAREQDTQQRGRGERRRDHCRRCRRRSGHGRGPSPAAMTARRSPTRRGVGAAGGAAKIDRLGSAPAVRRCHRRRGDVEDVAPRLARTVRAEGHLHEEARNPENGPPPRSRRRKPSPSTPRAARRALRVAAALPIAAASCPTSAGLGRFGEPRSA